jgi:hypothetical protein
MYTHNDLHLELYAEDYIRARLLEAENYRMLNQLRKQRFHGILRALRLFRGRMGRSLISLGKRLEDIQSPSVTYR